MSHTPGPWIRHDTPDYAEICSNDGHAVAMVAREADANLITAAPDLLAALRAVVSVSDRKTVEFDAARAAIAKATAP
jgi:hypothetical protein